MRESVTVVCPGWAGSGEAKAAELSHWRGVEMGLTPGFIPVYPAVLWEMQNGHWVLYREH